MIEPTALSILRDVREAHLDGRPDDVNGILVGDICSELCEANEPSTREIFKVFGVSTAHITQHDNELLEVDTDGKGLIVYTFEYGFWIYAGSSPYRGLEAERMSKFGYSDALLALVNLAVAHGCRYLQIDRDGAVYDDLTKFEW